MVAGNVLLSNVLCFTASLCTLWKTVLYLLVNVCGGEHGHLLHPSEFVAVGELRGVVGAVTACLPGYLHSLNLDLEAIMMSAETIRTIPTTLESFPFKSPQRL